LLKRSWLRFEKTYWDAQAAEAKAKAEAEIKAEAEARAEVDSLLDGSPPTLPPSQPCSRQRFASDTPDVDVTDFTRAICDLCRLSTRVHVGDLVGAVSSHQLISAYNLIVAVQAAATSDVRRLRA
jgi:hypothetical protein